MKAFALYEINAVLSYLAVTYHMLPVNQDKMNLYDYLDSSYEDYFGCYVYSLKGKMIPKTKRNNPWEEIKEALEYHEKYMLAEVKEIENQHFSQKSIEKAVADFFAKCVDWNKARISNFSGLDDQQKEVLGKKEVETRGVLRKLDTPKA